MQKPGKANRLPIAFANGVTKVDLFLQPNDAVFVVFRNKAIKSSVSLPPVTETTLVTLNGDWDLSFQKDRGAPASIKINELSPWADNAYPGVKYFSGTGTYTKTFKVSPKWFTKNNQLWMDLGDVKNLAEVIVNGKSLGILWKKPFQVNVTRNLKPGVNTIVIKVTNLWVNRLIGDQQPGVTTKITYTTMPFYNASSALLPSGLLGPVQIISKSK